MKQKKEKICKNCKWFNKHKRAKNWCWYPVKERCPLAEKMLGKEGGQLGKIHFGLKETDTCKEYKNKNK